MNCQNHPEVPATAYCRACGKAVCDECRRDAFGTVFCAEHVPAPAGAPLGTSPAPAAPIYTAPPPVAAGVPPAPGAAPGYVYADVSPGLALFLGMIPGVGAIYNGQYAKGLVHAIVFGILVSIADRVHGAGDFLFGIMAFAWWAYMVFEAYHTAKKRRMGEPVDEYSSVLNIRGGHNVPVAGVALIVLGILLLLETLNLFDFEYVARYWPVLLIAAGAYLLYGRFAGHAAAEEVRHERQ